ncbi:MAG: toll/interleukin-1 receptor domain-containing protein [Rhodospirillales bacterium]|nr:toll/interleukin-1 receptor domain-containing protein [Rhodospirillales bacterium]
MTCALAIYVIWHPDSVEDAALARQIALHFDGDEPVRDGLGMRIPVRVRSQAWGTDPGGPPRPIAFDAAEVNFIVVLDSWALANAAGTSWRGFFSALTNARASDPLRTRVLAFSPKPGRLPGLSAIQQVGTQAWPTDERRRRDLFLIHITNAIGQHLKAREKVGRDGGNIDAVLIDRERLFLSHAKADGWALTQAIEQHLQGNTYGVETFVDATDLPGGARFDGQFDAQIARSALVVIRSDQYGTRPWCRWEMLRGKLHHRPVLVVDLIERGEARIFPYGGNVPAMRIVLARPGDATGDAAGDGNAPGFSEGEIERIILAMMTEVLRALVWRMRAEAAVARLAATGGIDPGSIAYFLRTPELVDVVHLRITQRNESMIVYPDPPLDEHERPLIEAIGAGLQLRALSELEAVP